MDAQNVIPIVPEAAARHGNALPLLHEIRHALAQLAEGGESTVIDLRSLPMTGDDWRELEAALGRGEVEATIEAGGTSTVRETNYPGVWLVEHAGEEGGLMARFIEVAEIPALLKSQPEDIQEALERLDQELAGDRPSIEAEGGCGP